MFSDERRLWKPSRYEIDRGGFRYRYDLIYDGGHPNTRKELGLSKSVHASPNKAEGRTTISITLPEMKTHARHCVDSNKSLSVVIAMGFIHFFYTAFRWIVLYIIDLEECVLVLQSVGTTLAFSGKNQSPKIYCWLVWNMLDGMFCSHISESFWAFFCKDSMKF